MEQLLTIADIHGHGKNITKANAYLAMRGRNHVASVLSSWDKKEHARKRRYIRQGFTDFAVRGYEAAIKSNIHTLRDQLLLGNEPAHGDATGQWSSPRDMTHLGEQSY